MKIPFRVLLLCATGLVGQQALAATASATFNASVTLTSVCRVKTGSDGQTLSFGTYTAFQGTAQGTGTGINIDFECTRGFAAAPTVAFDSGPNMTSTPTAATATGEGVVAGLWYTLLTGTVVTTGGTAATTSGIGTPDTYRFPVSGSMPAGQAGSNSTGAQTQARQLIITY